MDLPNLGVFGMFLVTWSLKIYQFWYTRNYLISCWRLFKPPIKKWKLVWGCPKPVEYISVVGLAKFGCFWYVFGHLKFENHQFWYTRNCLISCWPLFKPPIKKWKLVWGSPKPLKYISVVGFAKFGCFWYVFGHLKFENLSILVHA